nr:GNAT family N-acetyltransferase [Psychrobacter faecalis]
MINNTKVYLRALESEDYKKSIEWRNNAKIWDMVLGRRYFVSGDFEKKWVESANSDSSNIKLAICDKKNDAYIGNIYLSNINFFNRSASFAILIGDEQYWGGGWQ